MPRKPRHAPHMDYDPLDRYSSWDVRIASAFYYSIIVASVFVVLGIWLGIITLLVISGSLPALLALDIGFIIAIWGGLITGHLLLLVLFYTLFRGGIVKLCRVLFKDRIIAKKYEDYSVLRWLIAILLTGTYVTIFGLVIALIPSAIFQGLAGLWIWMVTNLIVWQWILAIGITAFVIIGFLLLGFALWNHGVYYVLKHVKQIEEEEEVSERIKVEKLRDADEEALQKAYNKETGKRAIYRGRETKGYIKWKQKIKA